MVFGYEIKTKDIGTLEFLHLQDDDRHFAFFEMTDYQGFTASSELVPLPNESRLPIETTIKMLVDSQTITMSLDEATMVVGAGPSLQLDYSVTNHTGQSIAVRISKYRFDGTTYDWGFFGGRCYVVPKEKTTARIFMDAEDLRRIGITRIEELSFTVSVYRSDNAYDANAHIIEEHEVSIPLHVDLSAFG